MCFWVRAAIVQAMDLRTAASTLKTVYTPSTVLCNYACDLPPLAQDWTHLEMSSLCPIDSVLARVKSPMLPAPFPLTNVRTQHRLIQLPEVLLDSTVELRVRIACTDASGAIVSF